MLAKLQLSTNTQVYVLGNKLKMFSLFEHHGVYTM